MGLMARPLQMNIRSSLDGSPLTHHVLERNASVVRQYGYQCIIPAVSLPPTAHGPTRQYSVKSQTIDARNRKSIEGTQEAPLSGTKFPASFLRNVYKASRSFCKIFIPLLIRFVTC